MSDQENPVPAPSWQAGETVPPNSHAVAEDLPQQIGRYRVDKVLGEGGFGRVYPAHDDQLNRPVAIKAPHRERISSPAQAEAYLTEARVVASLEHPHIVPVYDVGSTGTVLTGIRQRQPDASRPAVTPCNDHGPRVRAPSA